MDIFYASYASIEWPLIHIFIKGIWSFKNSCHHCHLVTVKVGSAQLPHHKWRKKKFGSAGKKCGGSQRVNQWLVCTQTSASEATTTATLPICGTWQRIICKQTLFCMTVSIYFRHLFSYTAIRELYVSAEFLGGLGP